MAIGWLAPLPVPNNRHILKTSSVSPGGWGAAKPAGQGGRLLRSAALSRGTPRCFVERRAREHVLLMERGFRPPRTPSPSYAARSCRSRRRSSSTARWALVSRLTHSKETGTRVGLRGNLGGRHHGSHLASQRQTVGASSARPAPPLATLDGRHPSHTPKRSSAPCGRTEVAPGSLGRWHGRRRSRPPGR